MTITDEESARAWLDEQDHQTQVWFAVRCALRATPGVCEAGFAPKSKTVLDNFRAALASAAVATCPLEDMAGLTAPASTASSSTFGVKRYVGSSSSLSVSYAASAAARSAGSALSAALSASYAAAYSHDKTFAAANSDKAVVGTWPALWHNEGMPIELAEPWKALETFLASEPKTWGFWLEWYSAILNGDPLDWALSHLIVSELKDEDWWKGPEHVAVQIARIRALFRVKSSLAELSQDRKIGQSKDRLGIGGNNPPEEIEAPPEIIESTVIVWAAVDAISEEVASDNPDRDRVEDALKKLRSGLFICVKWLGQKSDLLVDTAIKWSVPAAGAGYIAANPKKVETLIKAVEAWLPFL